VYTLSVNGDQVGSITLEPNGPQVVTQTFNLDQYRQTEPLTISIVAGLVKLGNAGSELDHIIVVDGVVRENDRFQSDLLERSINDTWVIQI
jgi:hypothetical protein